MRLREAALLTAAGLVVTSLVAAWRWRWVFWGLAAGYVLLGGFLALPGRPIDAAALQKAYTERLLSFRDVTYLWGGESRRGIDCSGLVREAMVEALMETGLKTANARAIRESISLWWNDTTAEKMGQGYNGRMRAVTTCRTLNALGGDTPLQPGDVAVTTSGAHVMAYAGDRRWVGADPSEGKVTILTLPEEKNGYFACPMNIMRWELLAH